jgi:hypothetical protein
MTYKPGHAHVNTNAYPVPASLRFRTLPAGRSRIHKWAHNRAWPIKDNLGAGDLIDPEPEAYMDALQLFLEACGIDAYVPDPPHRPVLEF